MAVLFSFTKAKTKSGFSLIELMIVIAIIATLSALGLVGYREGVRRAKVAQAQGDLDRLKKAVSQLEFDTGFHPGHDDLIPCITSPLLFGLSNSPGGSGLAATDGLYPNWRGPYIEEVPLDPWGKQYYFQGNYQCDVDARGCKEAGNVQVRAMYSGGANKSLAGISDKDNVVVVLCK
jgi:prepilin-type N-terminal cleavage/methylation domain-containing protein